MGATAFLPVRNCQRPLRAHGISAQPAPRAPQAATAARSGHERGTKRARKGHGLGTVFTTEKIATIAFDSTCAAEKSFFLRSTTDLRNEPTLAALPPPVPACLRPC